MILSWIGQTRLNLDTHSNTTWGKHAWKRLTQNACQFWPFWPNLRACWELGMKGAQRRQKTERGKRSSDKKSIRQRRPMQPREGDKVDWTSIPLGNTKHSVGRVRAVFITCGEASRSGWHIYSCSSNFLGEVIIIILQFLRRRSRRWVFLIPKLVFGFSFWCRSWSLNPARCDGKYSRGISCAVTEWAPRNAAKSDSSMRRRRVRGESNEVQGDRMRFELNLTETSSRIAHWKDILSNNGQAIVHVLMRRIELWISSRLINV